MTTFDRPTSETSPYRNERDALRERKERIENDLARLRARTKELSDLKAQEDELVRELETVDGFLRAGGAEGTKRSLPLLDRMSIASPCKADWNEMVGDERVRFCLHCEKNVYNLSSMSREGAEELLRSQLGDGVCVRYYQREDGTVLTQDCPVGVKKKRRKKIAMAAAGASMLAAAATFASRRTVLQGEPVLMGAVAVPIQNVSPPLDEPAPPSPPVPSSSVTDPSNEPSHAPRVPPASPPRTASPTTSPTPPKPRVTPKPPERPMLMGKPAIR